MSQINTKKGAILCNSNFYRLRSTLDSWEFYKCTTSTNFKLNAEALSDAFKTVVVAGLDSIVAEIKTAQELEALYTDFSSIVSTLQRKNVSITIAPIVPWKSFSANAKEASKAALIRLKESYPNVLVIDAPGRLSFDNDGVHLTEASAKKLLDKVIKRATDHAAGRTTGTIDETEDETVDVVDFYSTPLTSVVRQGVKRKALTSPETPGIANLTKEVKKLRQDVDERRMLDYMVFARHQEELDQLKNDKNLHKIVMYGVEIPDLFKIKKGPARDQVIKARVLEIFKEIDLEVSKLSEGTSMATDDDDDVRVEDNAADVKIAFVRHLNGHLEAQNPSRQMIEVRLGDQKQAATVRRLFGKLSKSWRLAKRTPANFSGLSITNCITKETRVRIDIMQALAKVIKANSRMDAYVIQHISRPLMRVTETFDQGSRSRSYSFTEAIAFTHTNCPGKLKDQDLLAAYNRAGNKYGPEISHHFVVLKGKDYPFKP